jgi:glycosyltransferase involved in cell wall biosynthesis
VYLSVIIPTLNRASLLRKTLESLVHQQQPDAAFEVIVIDNGSQDDTRLVVNSFTDQIDNLVYIFDNEPGQLTGRHRGFEVSRGEILSYLDDDVELNNKWICSVFRLTRDHPNVAIFGGPSRPSFESDPPDWLSDFWSTTPYGGRVCLPLSLIDLDAVLHLVEPVYVFGLNFTIRKTVLTQLKGFHPDCIPAAIQQYQGDGETGLSIKAAMNGFAALHSSSLALNHFVPVSRLTPEYFAKWSYYNGVCQSFTDLRYRHKLYTTQGVNYRKRKSAGVRLWEKIKRMALRFRRSGPLKISNSVVQLASASYYEGYKFHQQAFENDELVRNWVLKPDFLDYHLPISLHPLPYDRKHNT